MPVMKKEEVWELLDLVKDPEIPVVSVVEMGLIRGIEIRDKGVELQFSPTFLGCPALQTMRDEIRSRLSAAGFEQVEISIQHHPAWSSEWITPIARQKLKEFGLAPPPRHAGDVEHALEEAVPCPYCGSQDTVLKNSFGPTLCRAIYFCNGCRQPFEGFKPV